MTRRFASGTLTAITIVLVTCAGTQAQLAPRTIALTMTDGSLGPGFGPGLMWSELNSSIPAFSNNGKLSFIGKLSTSPVANSFSTHAMGVNTTVLFAGGGQPGGGSLATNAIFSVPLINDAGHWGVRLVNPGSPIGTGFGAFGDASGSNSNPQRLARVGDVVPETGGATFGPIAVTGGPLMNSGGLFALLGQLTADGTGEPPVTAVSPNANHMVVLAGAPGAMSVLLRANQPLGPDAPGGLPGVGIDASNPDYDATGETRVGPLGGASLAFNGNGRYLVWGNLQGANVVTTPGANNNSTLIMTNRFGAFEIVARAGRAAPDASGALSAIDRYGGFNSGQLGFNNSGRVAFSCTLRNEAGATTSSGAIFTDIATGAVHQITKFSSGADGLMPTIYAVGDATGTTPLGEFSGLKWGTVGSSNLPVNAEDTLLFLINYGAAGAGGIGVFSYDRNGLYHKVVVRGDVAVGAVSPVPGDSVTFSLLANVPGINARGDVAFYATLTSSLGGVSGTNHNNTGLFAVRRSGTMVCVAQSGGAVSVAPGDVRTIESIGGTVSGNVIQGGVWCTGGQDGHSVSLTNTGHLAYSLKFTDGTSGIFVARIYCPADIASLGGSDGPDGATTVDDLVYFLAQFFANNLAVADIVGLGGSDGPDGVTSVDDLVAYLGRFFAGCN